MNRLFRDLDGRPLCPRGSVVCVGAFDGLHLGHQALLRRTRERADALDCDAAVVSFEPLPREVFAAADPPSRLTLPGMRLRLLRAAGADVVGLLRFGPRLSALSAEDFVRRVLVQRLSAREVWVGPGFRFGHRRAGDLALLQALGERQGFAAAEIEALQLAGERVSATRIRGLLADGAFEQAARLLGRPYRTGGRVVRGQQLGRTLGYPTANVRLGGRVPPLRGIFATRVHGIGPDPMPSVSSLGTRPTVNGREPLLEAHVFDFEGDLYGRRIEVEFVAKLRDEEKFDDLPALVAQMDRDAADARRLLGLSGQPERTFA